jgi:membrane associated rhomboid family serine protease
MIPLRDLNPRNSFPVITVLLIAANVAVFVFMVALPPFAEQRFLFSHAMIPAKLGMALADPRPVLLTAAGSSLVTSMFLHGGLLHLLGNMWFLWVFGDNVEDRLGHARYLLFYAVCGVGGALAHAALNLNSTIPVVGASGAISGVLGAYMVLFPGRRVVTLIPLVVFFFTVQLPAVVILGYWFVIQFVSGVSSLGGAGGPGVAWWAHIGGFVLGILLLPLFTPRRRSPQSLPF